MASGEFFDLSMQELALTLEERPIIEPAPEQNGNQDGPNNNVIDLLDGLKSESWRARAECKGMDPEIFFDEHSTEAIEEAKKFCGICVVQEACLAYAMSHKERFGVWGGKSTSERNGKTRKGKKVS